jgi:hypothetical protein
MILSGIEPVSFRLVAEHLNHYATALHACELWLIFIRKFELIYEDLLSFLSSPNRSFRNLSRKNVYMKNAILYNEPEYTTI